MFSCARRNLAAATIFIARVICCVLVTDAMRLLICFKEGMLTYRDRITLEMLF